MISVNLIQKIYSLYFYMKKNLMLKFFNSKNKDIIQNNEDLTYILYQQIPYILWCINKNLLNSINLFDN